MGFGGSQFVWALSSLKWCVYHICGVQMCKCEKNVYREGHVEINTSAEYVIEHISDPNYRKVKQTWTDQKLE